MIGIHYIIVVFIKYRYAMNFREKGYTMDKIFHVLSQLQCPSSYKDWDEDDDFKDSYEKKFKNVLLEMKYQIFLFTTEHMLMCIPVWILSYSITMRNSYLTKFFPLLEEEWATTKLAYALSALCPIFFILLSCAQYGLFLLYHKHGHPWSKILFSNEKSSKKVINLSMIYQRQI